MIVTCAAQQLKELFTCSQGQGGHGKDGDGGGVGQDLGSPPLLPVLQWGNLSLLGLSFFLCKIGTEIPNLRVSPVVMYGCESWTIKRLSAEGLMLSNYGAGEDSCESLGLQGDQNSPS